jgi:hypothetical protein
MDYIHGKSTIENNNLIPRKISKKIINFINFNNDYLSQKDLKISKYISYDQLCYLRKKFQIFKKDNKKNKPRNLRIYEFINSVNPNKLITYNKNGKLILPEFNGIKLSLSSILLNSLNLSYNKNVNQKINFVKNFKNLIIKCKFKKISLKEIENLYYFFELIKKKNKILYIVTPCCPDYSKVKIGNQYNFTFNSIENGIGLVAKRLEKNIKEIHEFLKSNGIKFKHIISIGDFEAYSEKNLEKLNLTKKEFLKKTRINQIKIEKKFKDKRYLTKKMFSENFGAEAVWKKNLNKFYYLIKNGKYGQSGVNDKILNDIIKSRISLYKKWYGNCSFSKYKEILESQAAEYATMGFLIKKKFKYSLIIGADHYRMSPFYLVGSNIPVLYLKKNYIT